MKIEEWGSEQWGDGARDTMAVIGVREAYSERGGVGSRGCLYSDSACERVAQLLDLVLSIERMSKKNSSFSASDLLKRAYAAP